MNNLRFSTTVLACLALASAAMAQELEPITEIDLARNGGFETGRGDVPDAWSHGRAESTQVRFLWDTDRPHSGKQCLGIASELVEERPWFWWDQPIKGLKPGQSLLLTGWLRREGTPLGVIFGIRFLDAGGNQIQMVNLAEAQKLGPEWTAVDRSVTTPAGTAAAVLRLALHGKGAAWVDDASLLRALTPVTRPVAESRVYPVVEAKSPIVIEGKTNDWGGVPRARVEKATEVSQAEAEVLDREAAKGAQDLSFSFALACDPKRLCLAVEVLDDVRRFGVPYWQGDSVQLAIDTEFRRSTQGYGAGDYAIGIDLSKGKPAPVVDYAPEGSSLKPADIEAASSETSGGYTIELAIPWNSLGIKAPTANQRLGFAIVVNDSDGAGRKWAEWTPGIVKGKRPADFGTLILMGSSPLGVSLEAPAEPPADTKPLELTAWLASMRDQPTSVVLGLAIDGGAGGLTDAREISVAPGVTQVPLVYKSGAVQAGEHTAALVADHLRTDCRFEVRPVQAVIAAAQEELAKAKDQLTVLRAEIAKGRERKIDVAFPDVTLFTAELFQEWVPADLARDGDEDLALREAQRLARLVEGAVAEMGRMLSDPQFHPAVEPPNVMTAERREGGWCVGQRPVFLIGLNQTDPHYLDQIRRLGCNLTHVVAGSAAEVFPSGPTPDVERIKKTVVEPIRKAEALGIRTDVHFGHAMPSWLVQKHPDVLDAEGHFLNYDISQPDAVNLTCAAMEEVGRLTSDVPGVLSYDLWNEAAYSRMSKRAVADFRQAMRKRYETIERLNAEWGTSYTDFDSVEPVERDPGQPAAYADWCAWNESRVTAFITAMHKALRRGNASAPAHVKIANEMTLAGSQATGGRAQETSRHWEGIDRYTLSQLLEINGCDTRPTLEDDKYALAFLLPAMSFDLQRSMAPGIPIFDSEWHGVQTVYYQNEDQPAEFLNAALWLSYLHGMDANSIWWWSRDGTQPKKQWFRGSLMTQPQLLDAFGRNSVAVQRFAPEIVAFTDNAPRVRFLYSEPSAILDVEYLDALRAAYETALWLDAPLGFVTEDMLFGGFDDMDLLIVPAARHASAGLRETIVDLVDNKKLQVILIGPDCLTLTPHGKPIDKPAPIRGQVLESATDGAAFETAMAKAGIPRLARCRGDGGLGSKPVEFRSVAIGKRRLGYIIGLGKKPGNIEIQIDGKPAHWRSLLTGQRHDGPLPVKPYDVDLFEFE